MPRLLFCWLLFAVSLLSASVEGGWELLSLEEENKGQRLGTVVFREKTANVVLADGTKISLSYSLTNGYLAGDAALSGKKTISILRGRFDDRRDSLTMALIIRYLDNPAANRSLKVNATRIP